ncbi:hypothetical protein C8Q74DRAFT_245207 [Fomes fomentarius]|nr:hypothetical protein C8Q74DRAFT_245207 [Fomes fomentarius]
MIGRWRLIRVLTRECWGTFCSYTPLTTYTAIAQPARAASSCEAEAFLRFLAVALVPSIHHLRDLRMVDVLIAHAMATQTQ